MAKRVELSEGQKIVNEIMSEGCEDCCGFCAEGQRRLVEKIDAAIKKAISDERARIGKLMVRIADEMPKPVKAKGGRGK